MSGKCGHDLLIDLLYQARPIPNRGVHAAAMDEVEFAAICPFVFDVVDFEAYVRRYPAWLDRTQVIAQDLE